MTTRSLCEGVGKPAILKVTVFGNQCPDCWFVWESMDRLVPPDEITPDHAPHFDDEVDEDPPEPDGPPADMIIHRAKALFYAGGPATSSCGQSAPPGKRWGLTDDPERVTCQRCNRMG